MGDSPRKLWRALMRPFRGTEDRPVVLDRREGERRQQQQVQPIEAERRTGERRRPLDFDAGEVRCGLGEGIRLTGALPCRGALRLDGCLEGAGVRGELLIIAERGQVHADIEVEIAQVSGEVQGNITARQQVELLGSSRVTGTIRTPRLVIWKGAFFNGTCAMSSSEGREEGSP